MDSSAADRNGHEARYISGLSPLLSKLVAFSGVGPECDLVLSHS